METELKVEDWDELISFSEASGLIPGEPHVMTIHRWSRQGLRGVKLESVLVGNKRFTSRAALSRFFIASSVDDISIWKETI